MAPVTERRVPRDTLAVRLKIVRHELGYSQREAAERTGVPFGVWQGMESGRETRNLGEHVAKISAATGYRPVERFAIAGLWVVLALAFQFTLGEAGLLWIIAGGFVVAGLVAVIGMAREGAV